MLFNSYIFIFLFFPLALIGYYGLQHFAHKKLAVGFLILMSMCFYGYNSITYLGILMISILLNYLLVGWMRRTPDGRVRSSIFAVGLLLNIGILFIFKYYDFFIAKHFAYVSPLPKTVSYHGNNPPNTDGHNRFADLPSIAYSESAILFYPDCS